MTRLRACRTVPLLLLAMVAASACGVTATVPAKPAPSRVLPAPSRVLLAYRPGGESIRLYALHGTGAALLDTLRLQAPVLAMGPGGAGRALVYVAAAPDRPAALGGLLQLDLGTGRARALTLQLRTPRRGTMYTGIEMSGGRVAGSGDLVAVSGFHGGGLLEVTRVMEAGTFAQIAGTTGAPLQFNGTCGPQLLAAGGGRLLLGAPVSPGPAPPCAGTFTFGWASAQHGVRPARALNAWAQPAVAAALSPAGALALLGSDGRLWVRSGSGRPRAVANLAAMPPYDRALPFVAWDGASALLASTDGRLEAATLQRGGGTSLRVLKGVVGPDYALVTVPGRAVVPSAPSLACALDSLAGTERRVWVALPPAAAAAAVHVGLSRAGRVAVQRVGRWDAPGTHGAGRPPWLLIPSPKPADAQLGAGTQLPLLVPTASWMAAGTYRVRAGSFHTSFAVGARC